MSDLTCKFNRYHGKESGDGREQVDIIGDKVKDGS